MSGKISAMRLPAVDWTAVGADLDAQGWAVLPGLIAGADCDAVAAFYDDEDGFRSRVVMARHGFGRGEYRYFSYPLPPIIQDLRAGLYTRLAPIANRWHERLGIDTRFPPTHQAFIDRCHAAGQTRPTPLLLRHGPEDYNCLHRDLYGEHVFPLRVATLLSEPGRDFTGGEFVLTEQRPRMQTRPAVVPLAKGDAVLFAVNSRPVRGTRGDYRVALRHGVSRIRDGRRRAPPERPTASGTLRTAIRGVVGPVPAAGSRPVCDQEVSLPLDVERTITEGPAGS